MSEWTEWKTHKPTGDQCPIDTRTFEVRFRNGNEERFEDELAPSKLWWGDIPGDELGLEIIAYRTLKEPKP